MSGMLYIIFLIAGIIMGDVEILKVAALFAIAFNIAMNHLTNK